MRPARDVRRRKELSRSRSRIARSRCRGNHWSGRSIVCSPALRSKFRPDRLGSLYLSGTGTEAAAGVPPALPPGCEGAAFPPGGAARGFDETTATLTGPTGALEMRYVPVASITADWTNLSSPWNVTAPAVTGAPFNVTLPVTVAAGAPQPAIATRHEHANCRQDQEGTRRDIIFPG